MVTEKNILEFINGLRKKPIGLMVPHRPHGGGRLFTHGVCTKG
jgi:hypothetical protein